MIHHAAITRHLVHAGPAPDPSFLSYNAEKDPEFCSQRSGAACHSERGSGWGSQPGRDTGGGVCEAGGQDGLHPAVSAEDNTACEHTSPVWLSLLLQYFCDAIFEVLYMYVCLYMYVYIR